MRRLVCTQLKPARILCFNFDESFVMRRYRFSSDGAHSFTELFEDITGFYSPLRRGAMKCMYVVEYTDISASVY